MTEDRVARVAEQIGRKFFYADRKIDAVISEIIREKCPVEKPQEKNKQLELVADCARLLLMEINVYPAGNVFNPPAASWLRLAAALAALEAEK